MYLYVCHVRHTLYALCLCACMGVCREKEIEREQEGYKEREKEGIQRTDNNKDEHNFYDTEG